MNPIRPNELRFPGEEEAIARIEAVFAAVDDLSPDALNVAAVPPIDLEDRDARLTVLEGLADGLGRGDLLDDARDALREGLIARYATRLGYAYGLPLVGTARPEDTAAVIAALLDLVAVAVVEDRLDPSDAAVLSRPGRLLLGIADTSDAAGLEDVGDAPLQPPPSPMDLARAGVPSEADWAEAEHGSTAIGPRTCEPPDW